MITHKPNSLCRKAELYYYDFLCDESRGLVPESIVSHTEECQHCQDRIDQLKDVLSQTEGHFGTRDKELSSVIGVLLKPHFAYISKPVTCNIVKPFLPSLLDPDLDIAIPTPITTHLDKCNWCSKDLETIRKLNLNRKQLCRLSQLFAEKPAVDAEFCSKALADVAKRAESDVVTIYHVDESAKAEASSGFDDIYTGFPIRVSIACREDEVDVGLSTSTTGLGALKQKVSAMNLKPLVKTAIAAAAVILIAVTLFFSIPTAKAVTIDQVYKAIEKVKNIYTSSFVADKREPIQELWVSRTLSNYMIKTGKQLVLWDIPNKSRKIKYLDTDLIETAFLSGDIITKIETKLTTSLGLLPFYDISEIPKDAEWKRVADDGLSATAKGTEVYDLSWTEKQHIGSVVFRRWRVFANAETNLPQKVEWYKKLTPNDEFTLETTMIVEYLSDKEIQAVIEESSF